MLRSLFKDLPRYAVSVFEGKNLIWHAVAMLLTALLVLSGTDWWFYESTRGAWLYPIVWTAGIGGFFVPVLVPVALYVAGEFRADEKLKRAGVTVAQAVILGLLISMLYKVFTGRVQPEFLGTGKGADISREFQFGILRNGIFWGWPSSHAAVSTAGAAALAHMYRTKPIILLASMYALVIALGAAVGFHWLSDVVAGVIIGSVVGFTVTRGLAK